MRILNTFNILLLLFVACYTVSARTIITINNQTEFDAISERLTKAINQEDNDIYVAMSPGRYVFSEQHLKLVGLNAPKKNVHVVGNGVVLLPKGKVYRDGDQYEGVFSHQNGWMCDGQNIDPWSHVRYADGLIEVLDANTKQCRLKGRDVFPVSENVRDAYILITQWYQSHVYKITKVEGCYIYFTADNLAPKPGVAGGFNINNDYYYMKSYPRYKLCNVVSENDIIRVSEGTVKLPEGVTFVREGTVNRLLFVSNCTLDKFEITGIKVWGNSNVKDAPLMDFINSSFRSARIHGCSFVGVRSNLINISSSNVTVDNNSFSDCYLNGIQSGNKSINTTVRDNDFKNMGKRMSNSFCVNCRGENFAVSGNSFGDFGYGGISCGVWYGSVKDYVCSGVVEGNSLTYSPNYLTDVMNYTLMDSGAIYLTTKMDKVVIRNNNINGYSGPGDNRGIFCDDGAYNFELSSNVITGIDNSYCIDARRTAHVEEESAPGSGISRANVNITIRDNIIDGTIRFAGHEDADNGCEYGTNYFLLPVDSQAPKVTVTNVTKTGEDVLLEHVGEKNGRIVVTRAGYKSIKKVLGRKETRKLFRRK